MSACNTLPAVRQATLPVLYRAPVFLPVWPEYPEADGAVLHIRKSAYFTTVVRFRMRRGETLEDGLSRAFAYHDIPVENSLRRCRVWVNGYKIHRRRFGALMPNPTTLCHVIIPMRGGGGGGKNPMMMIAQVAIIALAAIATFYIGGAGGWAVAAGFSVNASYAIAAGVSATIMMLGSALTASLASVPNQSSGGKSLAVEQSYAITGTRNSADPYGVVPVLFGAMRYAPPYGATPYSSLEGQTVYRYYLYVAGVGDIEVTDPRIGDDPFSNYSDIQYYVHRAWTGSTPLRLFSSAPIETPVGADILQYQSVVRACEPGASRIGFEVWFPRGLFRIKEDGSGSVVDQSVYMLVRYRVVGGAWQLWQPLFDHKDDRPEREHSNFRFSATSRKTMRYAHSMAVDSSKNHEIELVRQTYDSTTQRICECTWVLVRSTFNNPAIGKGDPITVIELRIKESNQLTGNLDEVNFMFRRYAPVPSGASWANQPTVNAVSSALLIAREGTDKPQAWSKLDQDRWRECYNWCASNGYEFSTLIRSDLTAGEATNDVLSGCRASYMYRPNMGHSVVWDDPDAPIDFVFTPRNSWGFSATKPFFIDPLQSNRVLFLNKNKDYAQDERIVYADGYNASNTTMIEDFKLTGQTDPDKVWRLTRMWQAEAELRPERYSFYADFSSLCIDRGSVIRHAHDVTMVGISQSRVVGRIVDVSDKTRLLGLELDEYCPMATGKSYAIRSYDGISDKYYSLKTEPNLGDAKKEVRFAASVTVASGPREGDLIMFGEANRESVKLQVLTIERAEDLTAKVTCCDLAPGIRQAASGTVPKWDSSITAGSPWSIGKAGPPTITRVRSDSSAFTVLGGGVSAGIDVEYITSSALPDTARHVELQYRLREDDAWQSADPGPLLAGTIRAQNVESHSWYVLRLRVVGVGRASDFVVQEHYTEGLYSALPDVTGLTTAYDGNRLKLAWNPVTAVRAVDYEIRRGTSWASAVVVGTAAVNSFAVPGDGEYLVKARALPAYSTNAAYLTVSGSGGLQANVIAVWDEAVTGWTGTLSNFAKAASSTLVYTYNPVGSINDDLYAQQNVWTIQSFYSDTPADWAIYTIPQAHRVMLASRSMCNIALEYNVFCHVENDLYAQLNIWRMDNFYGTINGVTGVYPQMRIFDGANWGPWSNFAAADQAGQGFDFRLMVAKQGADVITTVTNFKITVDVPDRLDTYTVGNIPASDQSLVYKRPFNGGSSAGVPSITATVLGASNGEFVRYFNVTNTSCDYCVMRGTARVGGFTAVFYVQGW